MSELKTSTNGDFIYPVEGRFEGLTDEQLQLAHQLHTQELNAIETEQELRDKVTMRTRLQLSRVALHD